VVVWFSNDTLGGSIGTDNDILIARSTDNGSTWTTPAPLNTNAAGDSGSDDYPKLKTDGRGNWVAVWSSDDTLGGTIGSDLDILAAYSGDNGATWTPPAPLNANATSDMGADRLPSLATDRSGNWLVSWQSSDSLGSLIGTDFDILFARFAFPDCNMNGVGDIQDIAMAAGADCNVNGVPDSCEPDADMDGVIDACEAAGPCGACGAGVPAMMLACLIVTGPRRRRGRTPYQKRSNWLVGVAALSDTTPTRYHYRLFFPRS
jgi:hypothetical protein